MDSYRWFICALLAASLASSAPAWAQRGLYGDALAKATAAVIAPPPAASQRGEDISNPWDLLKDSAFKSVYYKALGSHVKEDWLTKLDGPATPNSKMTVAGHEYLFAKSCKTHDCGDNNLVLLYSAARGVVYGKILLRRRGSLIGDPSPAVATELDRLWAAEWRQRQ